MAATSLRSRPSAPAPGTDLPALAEVLATTGEVLAAPPGPTVLDRVRDGQVLAGWPQEDEDLVRGAALLVESRVARESTARVRADHDRLFATPRRAVPALPLSRGLLAVAAACRAEDRAAERALAAAHGEPQLVRWLTQVAQRSTTFLYQGVAAAGLGALRRVGVTDRR